MNTTTSQSIRPNHVAAIVEKDGATFGRVILRGGWFVASRANGIQGRDIRRVTKFRSLAKAVAWIEAAA
jgi:hypothetical protein